MEIWATIPMFTVTTMTMSTARLVTPAVTTAAVSIAAIDMERTLALKRDQVILDESFIRSGNVQRLCAGLQRRKADGRQGLQGQRRASGACGVG